MKKCSLFGIVAVVVGLFLLAGAAYSQDTRDAEKKIMVKNLVNEAVELIETKGEDAIRIISDKGGKFYNEETYVFVTSGETGADIVNPAFEDIEGLPAESYTDPATKGAQLTIVNAVKGKDSSWVEYLWPKPGETEPVKKIAFLRKIIINGKERIVGAGFYPEE